MIASLLALLGTKALWIGALAVAAAACVWIIWRAAKRSERAAGLKRELSDRRKADTIAAETAREPDPKAALDREFGR